MTAKARRRASSADERLLVATFALQRVVELRPAGSRISCRGLAGGAEMSPRVVACASVLTPNPVQLVPGTRFT